MNPLCSKCLPKVRQRLVDGAHGSVMPAAVAKNEAAAETARPLDEGAQLIAPGKALKGPVRPRDWLATQKVDGKIYLEGEDAGQACEVCGCTADHACEGGCYWVDVGDPARWLCNQCATDVPARKAVSDQRSALSKKNAGGVVNHTDVPPAIASKKPRPRRTVNKRQPALAGGARG